MDYIKLNQETYNKIASHFSLTRNYLWDDLKVFKPYVKEGDAILDLGSGNGRLYQLFSDLSIDYRGLDQSEELLKEARQKFPALVFDLGEMTNLPYKDDSFEKIFCIAAFQHLPDRESRLKCLLEIKRVLKKDGILIMTNWNLYSYHASKRHTEFAPGDFIITWKDNKTGEKVADRYYHGFKIDELKELLDEAGFKILENYYSQKGKIGDKENSTNIVTVASVDK